jgi:DNA-binding CsgD family transcriptional regulator
MLRGRDVERQRLGQVMNRALAGSGSTTVLYGPPGSGRSALVDDLVDAAGDDFTVLRGAGVATESGLSFATLHQLLRPLLSDVDGLPGPQAAALRAVFGLDGGVPDRYLVGLATLTLLGERARTRPVLVTVDDVEHVDPCSARTLVFVARRLADEPVALVLVCGPQPPTEFADFAAAPLLPLDDHSAVQLLHDRYPDLLEQVTARVVAEAAGNPLALRELAGGLNQDQRQGRAPLPSHLPLRGRLERELARRMRRLPAGARRLLLVAAADTTGSLVTVMDAARAHGVDERDLGRAVNAGLLITAHGRVRFDPLVLRSVVYLGSPTAERQRAHRALGEVLGREHPHQAQHLAESTWRVDEGLAGSLIDAAESAWRDGDPLRVTTLLDTVRGTAVDVESAARITLLRALVVYADGSPGDAVGLLRSTAAAVLERNPELAARMRAVAEHAAWLVNEPDTRRITALWPPAVPEELRASSLPELIADLESGQWTRLTERARAELDGGEGRKQITASCLTTALLALVAARRGDHAGCHRYVAEVGHRVPLASALAQWASGHLALGSGDIDEAVPLLRGTVAGTVHAAVGLAALPDLVEALVRGRRMAAASTILSEADGWVEHEALRLRCRALLAGRAAGALYEEALAAPDLPPFERARTQLLYGEWLRRHHKVTSARDQLRTALAGLDLLGARGWAERCRIELRAAGQPLERARRVPVPPTFVELTPREREIVRSVAKGRSNRQIADELFISPRTVSDHLYKLFPKLGISSRHQLRDLRLELGSEHSE